MRRNKAWFFRNNALFEGLPSDTLDRIVANAETRELRKKRVIWTPGDPVDRLYLVRSGVVKQSRVTNEGRELTLHFFAKNDVFGEVAIFSTGPHTTVAEAYDDCTLYTITRDELERLLHANPGLAIELTRIISSRRERLESRLGGLLFKTAHARLAGLFLELAQDFGVRDSRGIIVNLKLTHKEMASLIGATRETVSFAILDLRRDSLILTESKRVVVLDEDALRALATG